MKDIHLHYVCQKVIIYQLCICESFTHFPFSHFIYDNTKKKETKKENQQKKKNIFILFFAVHKFLNGKILSYTL